LLAGTYKITPSLGNYTFAPVDRTVTIGPDATSQNFKINADIAIQYLMFLPKVRKQ
jgi:hypothetical protein